MQPRTKKSFLLNTPCTYESSRNKSKEITRGKKSKRIKKHWERMQFVETYVVYQRQIVELLYKILLLEYHLILLWEAIIVSCSYSSYYYLHCDCKVGLFLCKNLSQGIVTQSHFLAFSDTASWYKRTQPWNVLPLRQSILIWERLYSSAMHHWATFTLAFSIVCQAALHSLCRGRRQVCTLFSLEKTGAGGGK